MLVKASEFLTPSNNLSKQWKGVVKDNNDPLKLGRIKCLILGLTSEDADIDSLPWISCINPTGLGGSSDSSSFAVPELESEVIVEFPTRDIYFPVYVGYWQHSLTHQTDFNEDYPNSYGFRDSTGNKFFVNKQKGFAEFIHAAGSAIRFEDDGGITIRSRRKVRFESDDGATDYEFDMQEGGMRSNPKAETEQGGAAHAVTSKSYREEVGTKVQSINGGKDITIDGSEKKQIGGDKGLNVVGNVAETIGGDKSTLISGQTEVTYGLGYKESVVLGEIVREIIAGNYTVDITAGNLSFITKVGSVDLGNLIGKLAIDLAGNAKLSGLLTDVEALAVASVKGPLVQLGPGAAPVLTQLTSPVVDFITGAPTIGVPTVLA